MCIRDRNGVILAEGKRFHNGIVYSEIDVQRLNDERRRLTTYQPADDSDHIKVQMCIRDRIPAEGFLPDFCLFCKRGICYN